jgi:hypothetical protein
MASQCSEGDHDRVYAAWVLTSYPPKYKWICRRCGVTGIDTGRGFDHDDQREYDRLERLFGSESQRSHVQKRRTNTEVRKARCNRCGAEIEWWAGEDGVTLPIDPEKRENGYLILTHDRDGRRIAKRVKNGTHWSHFDTCPGETNGGR